MKKEFKLYLEVGKGDDVETTIELGTFDSLYDAFNVIDRNNRSRVVYSNYDIKAAEKDLKKPKKRINVSTKTFIYYADVIKNCIWYRYYITI